MVYEFTPHPSLYQYARVRSLAVGLEYDFVKSYINAGEFSNWVFKFNEIKYSLPLLKMLSLDIHLINLMSNSYKFVSDTYEVVYDDTTWEYLVRLTGTGDGYLIRAAGIVQISGISSILGVAFGLGNLCEIWHTDFRSELINDAYDTTKIELWTLVPLVGIAADYRPFQISFIYTPSKDLLPTFYELAFKIDLNKLSIISKNGYYINGKEDSKIFEFMSFYRGLGLGAKMETFYSSSLISYSAKFLFNFVFKDKKGNVMIGVEPGVRYKPSVTEQGEERFIKLIINILHEEG